jgi:hypothetical protein
MGLTSRRCPAELRASAKVVFAVFKASRAVFSSVLETAPLLCNDSTWASSRSARASSAFARSYAASKLAFWITASTWPRFTVSPSSTEIEITVPLASGVRSAWASLSTTPVD